MKRAPELDFNLKRKNRQVTSSSRLEQPFDRKDRTFDKKIGEFYLALEPRNMAARRECGNATTSNLQTSNISVDLSLISLSTLAKSNPVGPSEWERASSCELFSSCGGAL